MAQGRACKGFYDVKALVNLEVMFLLWGPKVKRGSKGIHKILGFLPSGMMLLLMETWG